MNKLCIIEPFLADYRRDVFRDLAEYCPLDILISPIPSRSGFGKAVSLEIERVRCFMVPTFKPFGEKLGIIQWGVGKFIFRERPDAIIISANPRYLSFWTTLFLGKRLRIPTYAHGHGLYKKNHISIPYRVMMSVLLRLVTSYICYAPIVRQSFIDHGFSDRNLSVAHNSMTNHFPVRPQEKTGSEKGVLFVGRLRRGNNLQLLVRSIERVRQVDGVLLTLHVIGTGEEVEFIRNEVNARPWIVPHGEIYDQERIREISLHCFVGCYPGNAGLSVEHLMSLSLPVITHDDLPSHQGPEPSFIRNGVSGLLYDHKNPEESLYSIIKLLVSDPLMLARMQQSAFDDYQSLVNPSLAARFWSILCNGQHTSQVNSLVPPTWTSGPSAKNQATPDGS